MSIRIEGSSPVTLQQPIASLPAVEERKAEGVLNVQEERPFAKVLHGLAANLERGERTMERVRHGGAELGATELLALQAEVYRYSEAVDLSAKLVDRTTNAVKTVLQGQ
jgi:hypothetical protein